jgi:hypothetical protein
MENACTFLSRLCALNGIADDSIFFKTLIKAISQFYNFGETE